MYISYGPSHMPITTMLHFHRNYIQLLHIFLKFTLHVPSPSYRIHLTLSFTVFFSEFLFAPGKPETLPKPNSVVVKKTLA